MAVVPVNTGSAPNDGTGDPLRQAFIKLNASVQEVDRKVDGALITGVIVGDWSAATGVFPKTRPDGSTIYRGDTWRVTAAGTVSGQSFVVGDYIQALMERPGSTYSGNWGRSTIAELESRAKRAELAAMRAEENAAMVKPQFDNISQFLNDTSMTTDTMPLGATATVAGLPYVRTETGDLVTEGELVFSAVKVYNEISTSQLGLHSGASVASALVKLMANRVRLIVDTDVSLKTTVTLPRLLLRFAGGSIEGYNGLGCWVSGDDADIEIAGKGRIYGFFNSTDRFGQATNYLTGFCRIASGTVVNSVTLEDFNGDQCRSVLYAGTTTSDRGVDPSITVKVARVNGIKLRESPLGVSLRCIVNSAVFNDNTADVCVGAMKVICPFQVYMDGQTAPQSLLDYANTGNVKFAFNVVRTVVTLAADGENHGFMGAAHDVHVMGNTFEDIYGANSSDCEASYVKATRYMIIGNTCINAGGTEGAMVCKGVSPELYGTPSYTGPLGVPGIFSDNIIEFDTYSYNLTSLWGTGGTVSLTRIGIMAAAIQATSIHGNTIIGANGPGIEGRGRTDSLSTGMSVTNNKILNYKGIAPIVVGGGHTATKIADNTLEYAAGNSASQLTSIRISSPADLGISRQMLVMQNNSVFFNDPDYAGDLRGINIDCGGYDAGQILIDGLVLDVTASATATVRPVALAVTTGSVKSIEKLSVKRIEIRKPQISSANPVVYMSAAARAAIRNYDFSFDLKVEVTSGANLNYMPLPLPTGCRVAADVDVSGWSKLSAGVAFQKKLVGGFHNESGTVTQLWNTDVINQSSGALGTATAAMTVDDTSKEIDLSVRGKTGEDWVFAINVSAKGTYIQPAA